jgi:maltooligosyltrehalose trehalohydrolase
MGEEYGEKNPFQFFTQFSDPRLIAAVREGRKKEFAAFAEGLELPDPQSEETFLRSNLSWSYQQDQGATLLAYYRHLIRLRKTRPALQGITREDLHLYPVEGQTLSFDRKILNDQVYIWLHFGDRPATMNNPTGCPLRKIFDSASATWQGPGENINNEKIELQPNSAVIYEKIIS